MSTQPHLPISRRRAVSRKRLGSDTDTTTTFLSQAAMVGQGIDVFGEYRLPESILANLIDVETAPTYTFNFLGTDYSVPSYVQAIEATSSEVIEDSVETRDSYQNSIAATADAAANIGAFSGQMSVSYSNEYASSSDYYYAYRNFYLGLATLVINLDEATQYRSQTFIDAIEALPETVDVDDLTPFEDFFDTYGYYFSSVVNLGGSLEYSVAVNTSSEQSTTDIAAHMKVEYKALFDSGSVSADYSSSSGWQSYQQNRYVKINMLGGDPVAISQVVALAETDPSSESVAAYDTWVNSVTTAPAATSFKVSGIWNLAPERASVLQEAFDLISAGLRPQMQIEAHAGSEKPTILLGVPIIPTDAAEYGAGFQVVILDRTNPTVSGVMFTKYYSCELSSEYEPYGAIWQEMVDELTDAGYLDTKYFFILATFNWSRNAPPLQQPPEYTAYSFLRSCGGSDDLVSWVDNSDAGSNVRLWPGVYALSGLAAMNAEGVESFQDTETIRQTVYFYKEQGSTYYTLSDGGTFGSSAVAVTAAPAAKSARRVLKTRRMNQFIVAG
jgi:hypothetical protein